MEDLSHYNPEGSVMRKTQMRLLEMFDVFVDICDRHNITYWIVCGTLLGARRHGGFIPWDDDLDVAVLQRDWAKLIPILKEELPENLKLQTRETDKKFWPYHPKIRDTRSRYYNKRSNIFEYNGIFLDIFLLEPVPSLTVKTIIDKLLVSRARFRLAKTLWLKLKYTVISPFSPIAHIFVKLSRIYYKYINSSSKSYAYSYGHLAYPNYNMEYFFPVSEIMFEGKNISARMRLINI
ncbi:MAG: LicD family protein [Segetibacter sp.]